MSLIRKHKIECTVLLLIAFITFIPLLAHSAEKKASCLKCHSSLEEDFKAAVLHSPFKDRKCNDCHNPHAAKHPGLLIDPATKLCFKCHDKGTILQGKIVHTPVVEGNCSACHNAHASSFSKLQKDDTVQLCFTCHDKKDFEGEYIHSPVAEGECSTCHDPHSSDFTKLLPEKSADLCNYCHDYDETFIGAHKGFPVGDSNCLFCHSPHASTSNKLLKANLHAPFEEQDCTLCHVDGSTELHTSMPELCFECHSDKQEDFLKIETHLINKCTDCHNPHGSQYSNLLNNELEELCFSCHRDTKLSMGEKKSLHPEGSKSCVNCHNPHGSDYPTMLFSDGIKTCDQCHETQGKFTHPVGEETLGPDNKIEVSCISCHQVMGSDYETLLWLPGSKLCMQCHIL